MVDIFRASVVKVFMFKQNKIKCSAPTELVKIFDGDNVVVECTWNAGILMF